MANINDLSTQSSVQSQEEMWNQIGFHKPLAGFWYRIILTIIGLFIGVLLAHWY